MLIDVERHNAQASAISLTRELNETYEAQVLRVLREIEEDFKLIQYVYTQQSLDTILPELARQDLLPPAFLFNVAIVDASGRHVQDSMPLQIPLDSADIAAQRHTDVMTIEARTIQARHSQARHSQANSVDTSDSGENQQPVIQFRRRLLDRQGDFAGVAVIEVDAAFFVSSYDKRRLGEHGTLGLLGRDGEFKVRRVGDSVSTGQAVSYQRYMAGMDEMETVVQLRQSAVDGVDRFVAARELFGLPLTVVVGIAKGDVFAPLQSRIQTYILRCTAINILLLLVITVLWHLSRKLAESRHQEMQAKIAHAEQVEYLAYHDGLTGLPNRSLFSQLLGQGIKEAMRQQHQLAVMFLDLDHFKHINDTLGHDAGDDLLKEVARRLKATLRASDVVARLGGDEFVVILQELPNPRHSATVAQKIINTIAQPFILQGQTCRVTASIGISTCPDDGSDEETLTNNADMAMYKAKQEGKNNFQLYSQHLHSESLERLALESNLRHALDKDQFRIYYSAKRDISSGAISGIEAQLRWHPPDLEPVPPSQFLGTAKDMGLLAPIGRWMLQQVCQQHADWLRTGVNEVSVALELWAPIFYADHVFHDVETALSASGLRADLLELEVSENVLMQDTDKAITVLRRLKTLGVRIAVGNFGVGYSCLSSLSELPVDEITIDRSVIHAISAGEEGEEMANAVCSIGQKLGLSLVVDGVETEHQMAFLKANTSRGLKGFYDSQSLPAEAFTALLQPAGNNPKP